MICVHVYENSGQGETGSIAELMKVLKNVSLEARKPLFVGEFGGAATLGADEARLRFQEFLRVIEGNKVPLSAFWFFDHSGQEEQWDVAFENERRYMLQLVAEANRRMKGG